MIGNEDEDVVGTASATLEDQYGEDDELEGFNINEKRAKDPKALVATLSAMHEADEVQRINVDSLLKGMHALKRAQVLALDGDKEGSMALLTQMESIELLPTPAKKSKSQKAADLERIQRKADDIIERSTVPADEEPLEPDWTDVIGGMWDTEQRQIYALKGGSDEARCGCFVYYVADPIKFADADIKEALLAAEKCTGVGVDEMTIQDSAVLIDGMAAFGLFLLNTEFNGLDRPTFTEGDVVEPEMGTTWTEAVNDWVEPVRSIIIQATESFKLQEEDEVELTKVIYRVAEKMKQPLLEYRGGFPPMGI